MAVIEQNHQDPLEREIFTVKDRHPFCAVAQYRSTYDDPYDPREVVGEMVMDIDPEIIDDLHAAGVSLDGTAIELVRLAQERKISKGDIIRDIFQGTASQPASLGSSVTAEALSELSQRIASTPDKPRQFHTFTPFIGDDDPLSLPSHLPPVLPTSFEGLLFPPSKHRQEPTAPIANPLPDLI